MKKKKQNKLVIAGLIVLVIIGAYFGGLFSLIAPALGEEGFEPRDVLTASGTYNPNLYNTEYETNSVCISSSRNCELCGTFTGCSWESPTTPCCSYCCVKFTGAYTDLSWYDKHITMSGSDVIISGAGKDYKTDSACYVDRDGYVACLSVSYDFPIETETEHIIEFDSVLHKGFSRSYAWGTNSISVNGKNVFTDISERQYYTETESHRLDIEWTSYQNGQYQVKLDGKAVTDILTASNNEIKIQFNPSSRGVSGSEDTNYGTFVLKRDETRQLFRCDPQEGEVLADMTFKAEDFDIDSLIGFKSFCSNIPALYNDGGVVSSDNRVYFGLAEGDLVRLGTNEAYRIFYIADGVEVGALDCSSGDSYSVDAGECADTTGFASICSSGSILVDGVCVTKIIDEVDAQASAEIVADNTISWTANGVKPTFSSLGEQLFSVSTPTYSCRATDGHDDRDRINYPQPSEDCWAFTLNDKPISIGQKQNVNQYWSIVFESAQASLRYDLEDGQNGVFEDDDDWGMTMSILLDNPFVDIDALLPSQLELGEAGNIELDFNNRLDSDVNGIVETVVSPDLIDNTLTLTEDVSLPSGSSTQELSLPTAYLGNNNALIFFTIRTDAGNLLASEVYEASYEVVKVVEDTGTQPIEETNEEVDVSQDTIQESGLGLTIILVIVMLVLISTFFVFNRGKTK